VLRSAAGSPKVHGQGERHQGVLVKLFGS
jgi:hypothetical protein